MNIAELVQVLRLANEGTQNQVVEQQLQYYEATQADFSYALIQV
jgi:hypothetical protein